MARTDKQRTHAAKADTAAPVADQHAVSPEAGDHTAAPVADQDTGAEAPSPPAEPTLTAFAAAIERKKADGQARSAHLDGVAKVGGATSNRKTSRTFRRKSG